MKQSLYRRTSVLLLVVVCSISAKAQSERSDQKIIDQTRSSYSILKRQGLIDLKASVVPNWEPFFSGLEPSQKAAGLKLASRLQFFMEADTGGSIKVTHKIRGPRPNKQTVTALESIARGIELYTTGFLMSWTPFMLTHLIPDQLNQFVLQDLGKDYLLSFKEREVDVNLTMTKELVITELKTANASLRPRLTRAGKGFLLTGFESDNEDPTLGRTTLKATIDSHEVSGLQVPRRVVMDSMSRGAVTRIELAFTNYQLTTK